MKRKLVWITLITIIILTSIIALLCFTRKNKENQEIEPEYNIYPDKKQLAVWISHKKEIYNNQELISEERETISMVFYENTIDICIQETDTCEELNYTETETAINIEKGNKIDFFGKFNKTKNIDINLLILEQTDNNGDNVKYYLSQPAG